MPSVSFAWSQPPNAPGAPAHPLVDATIPIFLLSCQLHVPCQAPFTTPSWGKHAQVVAQVPWREHIRAVDIKQRLWRFFRRKPAWCPAALQLARIIRFTSAAIDGKPLLSVLLLAVLRRRVPPPGKTIVVVCLPFHGTLEDVLQKGKRGGTPRWQHGEVVSRNVNDLQVVAVHIPTGCVLEVHVEDIVHQRKAARRSRSETHEQCTFPC